MGPGTGPAGSNLGTRAGALAARLPREQPLSDAGRARRKGLRPRTIVTDRLEPDEVRQPCRELRAAPGRGCRLWLAADDDPDAGRPGRRTGALDRPRRVAPRDPRALDGGDARPGGPSDHASAGHGRAIP